MNDRDLLDEIIGSRDFLDRVMQYRRGLITATEAMSAAIDLLDSQWAEDEAGVMVAR